MPHSVVEDPPAHRLDTLGLAVAGAKVVLGGQQLGLTVAGQDDLRIPHSGTHQLVSHDQCHRHGGSGLELLGAALGHKLVLGLQHCLPAGGDGVAPDGRVGQHEDMQA
eukprot:370777_1